MSDWQPIETAPKDGTNIILLLRGWPTVGWYTDIKHYVHGKLSYEHSGWKIPWGSFGRDKDEPTHWMPFPPLPAPSHSEAAE
jgi:hypothetical protein